MRSNLGTFATALLASAFATAAWSQGLGRVDFETSCTPQAQEKFDRGLAMVHSFFYPDSVQAFTEAAAADPQCAIAYWGIAISHRPNPLILPLTSTILKNGLEAVEKGKAIGAKTERERDWLLAIEPYYKDYDKVDQTERGLAYEKAMEALMQKYPDDPEAAIFYALALNETALHSDKTFANQLKAGAILEKIEAKLRTIRACCTISSTPTITRRSPNAVSMPPTDMPRLPPRRSMPSICPHMLIPCLGCGRSRWHRTRNRGQSPRDKRAGSGQGRRIQASRTIWTLWSTPCCN